MVKEFYSALLASPFQEQLNKSLQEPLQTGAKRFKDFNLKRLQMAMELFSPNMKRALFEVLFLLHHNQPSFAKMLLRGNKQQNRKTLEFDLYEGNAPAGILGLFQSPDFFMREMKEHILREFKFDLATIEKATNKPKSPIISVSSLGSIGTIAHKLEKSDLDLQIQYDLHDYILAPNLLNDDFFENALTAIDKKLTDVRQAKEKKGMPFNPKGVKEYFPFLFELKERSENTIQTLQEHLRLAQTLVMVYDFYCKIVIGQSAQAKFYDQLLYRRIKTIEEYIQSKYPFEELHFFAYSTQNYRQGNHGSTLESKESSGTAYEKILSYEFLLPGIQYNSVFPTHFLFSEKVNNNTPLYNALISCSRLGLLNPILQKSQIPPTRWIDLGNTPLLSDQYLAEHKSATFWEAFKGSSGNLPKAFLNLLRIENLNNRSYRHSIIQLIKNRQIYRNFFEETKALSDEQRAKDIYFLNYDETDPFAIADIYEIELSNPNLIYDPWWVRYKVLKMYYQKSSTLDPVSKRELLHAIDYSFALHVGLDDIFKNEVATHKTPTNFRLQILQEFFNHAFPPLSKKRQTLENIFLGEVNEIHKFETNLKKHFRAVINRIIKQDPATSQTALEAEKNIWYKHYVYNFEPKKGQIQKNLLTDLTQAKGRLQIYWEEDQWMFTSIRQNNDSGKRFDTFGTMVSTQDKVELYFTKDLLHGLLYCIINGYYSTHIRQMIKTETTTVELITPTLLLKNNTEMNFGRMNNFLLERVSFATNAHFPKIDVDYKDSIQNARNTREILIFINVGFYGRVHALTRDRMDNYFLFTEDVKGFSQIPSYYNNKVEKFLEEKPLTDAILKIVKHCNILQSNADYWVKNLHFWLNPLSVNHENAIRKEFLDRFDQEVQQNLLRKIFTLLGFPIDALKTEKEAQIAALNESTQSS